MNVDENPNFIKRISDVLKNSFPSWPEDILKLYVKTRTFIRIKYLNNVYKATEAEAKLQYLKKKGQFQF